MGKERVDGCANASLKRVMTTVKITDRDLFHPHARARQGDILFGEDTVMWFLLEMSGLMRRVLCVQPSEAFYGWVRNPYQRTQGL